MNPKNLEHLERFTAAALTGLCANHEMLKIAWKIDKDSNVTEGSTLGALSVQMAIQTINSLAQYASNQPTTTT